jgi:stage II sporulation protein D
MIFLLTIPSLSKAAEVKSYATPVNVSVYTGSGFTLKLNNPYQLTNKETGMSTMVPPNTTLTVMNNGVDVLVSFPGIAQVSSTGFSVKELSVTKQIAVFHQDTQMRRGATTSYDAVHTFKDGNSADYLGSFTNSANQLWYQVTDGYLTGWVPAQGVTLANSVATSFASLSSGLSYRGSFNLNKKGTSIEVINNLDMEDYLRGVVPSEMPASWPKEALKAQAIAARSFAATSMNLSSTASSQVYRGYTGEDARTNIAISETTGLVAKYEEKPIMAFFFSTSGGKTANYGDVWNDYGKSYPYYKSVIDNYEVSPYSNWTETFPASAILNSFGFNSSNTKLLDITLVKKGVNGEVGGVTVQTTVGSKTITGNESKIRGLFPLQNSAYYNLLYSNWFTLTATKSTPDFSVQNIDGTVPLTELKGQTVQTANGQVILDDSNVSIQTASGTINGDSGVGEITSVTLHGKGWGHRIGMSQYGAKGYAEHGWSAIQIIQHYFQGTTVSK